MRLQRSLFSSLTLALLCLGWNSPLGGFVISEIHYNPPAGEEDLEFIEITNESSTPQDISGWGFVDGIRYRFPQGTILLGDASLVVCRNADRVREHYGITNVVGNYLQVLDNGGERLTVVNHAHRQILSVRYNDQGDWPTGADGTGHSLIIKSVYADPAAAENWTISPELGGSPGLPNFPMAREPEYEITVHVDAGVDWLYVKGTQPFSTPTDAWIAPDFDDGSWSVGPSGFGFGDGDDATVFLDMEDNYTSVAIRRQFVLTQEDLDRPGDFYFAMMYDDGFCVFVDGQEAAKQNCPAEVAWDAVATSSHEARNEELFPIDRALLHPGTHQIAIVGFNRNASSNDFSLIPRLIHRRLIEEDVDPVFHGQFNELFRGDGNGSGYIELYNRDAVAFDLSGMSLTEDPARPDPYVFPAGSTIGPDDFLVVEKADTLLDLSAVKTQLFLLDPRGFVVTAATFSRTLAADVPLRDLAECRFPDGGRLGWITDTPTPGAANSVPAVTDIVFNEIFYNPPEQRPGEFIELYNRGAAVIDLSHFRFTDGITFTFPEGTLLAAGAYLVLSDEPELIGENYGLEQVYGPYRGTLANGGENLELVDGLGNLVDAVHYRDGGRWSLWADGRGASLELIDPLQPNDYASAWAPSDESQKADWERLSYVVTRYAPAGESELHILLAARGVCHLDDITIATEAFDEIPLLPGGANWRYRKGTQAFSDPPLAWTEAGFDDTGWAEGVAGFGFGDDDDATVLDDMRNNYLSIAVRTTFEVSREILDSPHEIFLAIDYDDGFCAFLNGELVADDGCAQPFTFESRATGSHEASKEALFKIDRARLNPGANVLAVAGFNVSVGSNDFSLHPRVIQRVPAGQGANHIPNPGFEANTAPWEMEGNHGDSKRISDDAHSGGACLELVATGKGDSGCNRIETDTDPRLEATEYEVSLWARWQRGASLLILHGEFSRGPWFGTRDENMSNNSLGARLRMTVPWNLGTPGAENSARVKLRDSTGSDNLGPVLADVSHFPLSPDGDAPVKISARAVDSDGIESVRVFYKADGSADFSSADLFDDGQHGDSFAEDGLFAGNVPGFPLRERVVFYVEAVDTLGANRRFPVEAPDETLLYMTEGTIGEQIQIVMTSRNATYLDSRRLHSNELVDGSFAFKNDAAYYNIGLRYRGSPWGRPQKQSYRVKFRKDQPFHRGRKEMNISNRDRDDGIWNFLIGRNSTPEAVAPSFDYQYVGTRINGRSIGVPGFFETVGRAFFEKWYGAEAVDDLVCLKALGRLRFNDSCTRSGWDEATLIHMDEYSENYRFYWSHAINQNRDNWKPFMQVTKVFDTQHTLDPDFDAQIHSVLNVEEFLRVLAPRILMNDGDAIFVGNGHNGYMVWNPTDGLWSLLPFDMGFSSAAANNLLNVRDIRVRRLFQRPETLRAHYRIIDDYVNGYWSAELAGPFLTALQASPGRTGAATLTELRTSGPRVKSLIRRHVDVPLSITTGDGEDFETEEPRITLRGRASVRVVRLGVRIGVGQPELATVAWSGGSTPISWAMDLELSPGENTIDVFALDRHGRILETVSQTIRRLGSEALFIRGDAQPDSRVNISDVIAVLGHAFLARPIACVDAADVDDNGAVDATDAIRLLGYLFLRGDAPPAPFPEPGLDRTDDALRCPG